MTIGLWSRPMRITSDHDLSSFDCGVEILNDWLRRRGVSNDRSDASRTYLICEGDRVAGFYSLSTGSLNRDAAPSQLRRNMPDPVPIVVLGRLAIDRRYQGQGLGREMLLDAVVRTLQVAENAAAVALVVHAISDKAREFYLSMGFNEWEDEPMTLFMMMRTARQVVADHYRTS